MLNKYLDHWINPTDENSAAEGVVDKIAVEDSDLSNPSVKKIMIMFSSPLPQSN